MQSYSPRHKSTFSMNFCKSCWSNWHTFLCRRFLTFNCFSATSNLVLLCINLTFLSYAISPSRLKKVLFKEVLFLRHKTQQSSPMGSHVPLNSWLNAEPLTHFTLQSRRWCWQRSVFCFVDRHNAFMLLLNVG